MLKSKSDRKQKSLDRHTVPLATSFISLFEPRSGTPEKPFTSYLNGTAQAAWDWCERHFFDVVQKRAESFAV